MKKCCWILFVIFLTSCSSLIRNTYFEGGQGNNWNVESDKFWNIFLFDAKEDTIFLSVSQFNYQGLSVGPMFVPVIPVSLFFFAKNDDPHTVSFCFRIKGNSDYLINTDSVFLYTQNGDTLTLFNDESLSNKRMSIEKTDGFIKYCGYYKTKNINKVKELTIEIKGLKINGEDMYLPPIKFKTYRKLGYRPCFL